MLLEFYLSMFVYLRLKKLQNKINIFFYQINGFG